MIRSWKDTGGSPIRRSGLPTTLFFAAVLVAGSRHAAAQSLTADFTFSPHDAAPGSAVQFTDASTGSGPIFLWFWDFGDPDSGSSNHSTIQNPTHTFAAAGEYSVTLTVDEISRRTETVHVKAGAGTCTTTTAVICLNNHRFAVNANWTRPDGSTGAASGVQLTDDSGYFTFFDEANIEMVVKVLNACTSDLGNAYWVFAAGLTNVQVNWQVVDTKDHVTFTPTPNPQRTPFEPVFATNAFPNACP